MTYALKRPIVDSVRFTMERFREALRDERERRVGAREKHAALAGVNKGTIQRAEVGPDIPGIDTVARLIEAMPGLTLSSFFAQIESLQDPSLQSGSVAGDTTSPPLAASSLEASRGAHRSVSAARDAQTRQLLVDIGEILLTAAARPDEPRRQAATTRARQPTAARRARTHRR